MWNIEGYKLDRFPFDNLKKIADLIYYDGPLLSHYMDDYGYSYLFYWIDFDDNYNRWLFFKEDLSVISKYLHRNISLFELINRHYELYIVDIDDDANYIDSWLSIRSNIPEQLLPKVNSFYNFTPENLSEDDNFYKNIYTKNDLFVENKILNVWNIKILPAKPIYPSSNDLDIGWQDSFGDICSANNRFELNKKSDYKVKMQEKLAV